MNYELMKEIVLQDAASMAFVIADLREGEMSAHRLHPVYDITEGENRMRAEQVIRRAWEELASAGLKPSLHSSESPQPHNFTTPQLQIRETVREYLMARVLADWLGITLPDAAPVWEKKSRELLATLRSMTRGGISRGRRVPPI